MESTPLDGNGPTFDSGTGTTNDHSALLVPALPRSRKKDIIDLIRSKYAITLGERRHASHHKSKANDRRHDKEAG